ncbi:hypothetical protein IAT38_001235 [Cryptococcus sp. DSM 104549]
MIVERNRTYQAESKRSPPTFKANLVLSTHPSPSLYSIHIRNTSPTNWRGYIELDPELNGVPLHTDFVPPEAGAHVVHHVLSPMGVGETGVAINGHHPCGQLTISLWRGTPRPPTNPEVSLVPWFETVAEDDVDPWCRFEFTYGTREALAARLAGQRGPPAAPALPVVPPPQAGLPALPEPSLNLKTDSSTTEPPLIAQPPPQQALATRPKRSRRPTWATANTPTPASPAPAAHLVSTNSLDEATPAPPAPPVPVPHSATREQPTNFAGPTKRPTARRVVVEVVLPLRKTKHNPEPLRDGNTKGEPRRRRARGNGTRSSTRGGSGRDVAPAGPSVGTSLRSQAQDLPFSIRPPPSKTRHSSSRRRHKRRWIDLGPSEDEQDGAARKTPKVPRVVKTRSESWAASSAAKGTETDPVVVPDDAENDLSKGTEADPGEE